MAEDAHGFGDPGLAPGEVGIGSWPLGIPGFIFENVEVGGVGDDGLGDGVGEFLEFLEGVALEQLGHFWDRIDRILKGLTGFGRGTCDFFFVLLIQWDLVYPVLNEGC
jgi:hypothetical protein